MRNLVVGTIFGIVAGAVLGATLIGPELSEQVPGFTPSPIELNTKARSALKSLTRSGPRQPSEQPNITPPTEETSVRWRMASAFGSTVPQRGELGKRIETQINRISGGSFNIQFHEPGALVALDQMFDAVSSGTIDAAFGSPGHWSDKIPALSLFSSIPFGPTSTEFLAWFYTAGGQKIYQEIYRKKGLYGLVCGAAAPEASGWFKNKIETIDDLKGLRIRIEGLGADVLAKLGAEPQTLSDADVIVAFEAGTLDAAEFSQPSIDLDLNLHHRADYYYFPGWHQPTTLFELIVNLDAWDALSLAHKTQIENLCGDNVRLSVAQSEALQFAALKELVNRDVSIQNWPKEVLDGLRSAWVQVVAERSKKDPEFKRIWMSLSRFREDYEIWRELSRP